MNMGTYDGAHNIKEIFPFCSFWDRAGPFPKKILTQTSFAITVERSIVLDDPCFMSELY